MAQKKNQREIMKDIRAKERVEKDPRLFASKRYLNDVRKIIEIYEKRKETKRTKRSEEKKNKREKEEPKRN